MGDDSPRPFVEMSTLCLRKYRGIVDEIRRPNDLHLDLDVASISDEMYRFKRWAGNIGASYMSGHLKAFASLENRVLEFLGRISQDLDSGEPSPNSIIDVSLILQVLQIVSGRRPNRVDTALLGLWSPPRWLSRIVPHRSRKYLTEIHELLATCQVTLYLLFRISRRLKMVSNSQRYKISADLTLEGGYQDDQLSEIAFVRQQFPKVRATPWLEKRLGLAVRIRREFVRWSREMYTACRGETAFGGDLDISVGCQALVPRMERKLDDDKQLAPLWSEAQCSRKARGSSIDDEPTTLEIAGLTISEEPKNSKSLGATYDTSENIPQTALVSLCSPFPKEGKDGAQFYCPYCWTIVSFMGTAEETQKLWKYAINTSNKTCG